ncbi:MAG: hypothetical protein MSA82_11780, partial [Oscillospiraceae bacterium]|nr:hypothetical protein [Oscillospiraceae bacterium]
MKKETFKRRIRKITAFAAAMAMAVTVTMPGEIFGNIDFGITVFAEENGYVNGFCTDYADDGECETHTGCNGYQPATDSDSDGVYEIGNAGQLYWFAALVNGTNGLTQNVGANAILTNNITINENVLVGDELNSANASSFRKWTPIGNSTSVAYTGTFDGKGNTISGLYYSENTTEGGVVAGLFGRSNGSISNIIIKDSYFSLTNTGTYSYLGALVGANFGTIKNCKTYSVVNFNGKYCYIGGLCGANSLNDSTCISECTNYGKITAVCSDGCCIGGVSGANVNKIENCNNAGSVTVSYNSTSNTIYVGGISGENYAEIKGCHNSGTVEGKYRVGGVCGVQIDYASLPYYGTITNCYNTGTVKGTSDVGGICGFNYWAGT